MITIQLYSIKIYLQSLYNGGYMNIKATREIIATNLRKFRAIKRISQEELAELSDLSQQYICSIENAKVNPSIFTMMKIAEALNVSVNDLIY